MLDLYEGMPPAAAADALDTTLITRKKLGDAVRYFDPLVDATYSSVNGLKITPENKPRFLERHAVIQYQNQTTGVELRFFDNKLYGVEAYIVMQGSNQEDFTKVYMEAETDFKQQFPHSQWKDLKDLNGGFGWTIQNDNIHAFLMIDRNLQSVTIHAWTRKKLDL